MTILRRATPRTPRIIAVSVVFAYAALAYALLFFGNLFSQASVAIGGSILFSLAIGLATQALADPSVTRQVADIWGTSVLITLSHTLRHAPQPLDAVVDGNLRQLRWTKGVGFQEHITARVENQTLTWLFVFNEQVTLAGFDPHISPNSRELNLTGGSYELTPTANGQTRLRLETRYSVQTPFNPYLKLWGNLFLQDFHTSVLEVIKMRSERSS